MKARLSALATPAPAAALGAVGALCAVLAGCGSSTRPVQPPAIPPALLAQARPIGRGSRFTPSVQGPVVGPCTAALGRRFGVHVELFGANRVVLVAAGIGTRAPRRIANGRVAHARCYGDLVTLDPTGLVLVRPGLALTLADLFRAWGQPLSSQRLAGFSAPPATQVRVYVDGHRWRRGPVGGVALAPHAEIVLEVGPYVPPHASYTFPPGS